jgi:nucleotide-binding universal stress UspA family protein
MIEIKRILCPVDFSDVSRHALQHAMLVARWYASEITVLHVHLVPVMTSTVPFGGPVVIEPVIVSRAEREQVTNDLRELVRPLADESAVVALEVCEGTVVDEILAKAKAMPADMIVLGTHGRSGFDRLFLGSVAEKVLRKAPCPILTVPRRATPVTARPSFQRILCAVDFSASSLCGLHYAIALAKQAGAQLSVIHVLEVQPEVVLANLPVFRDYHDWLKSTARERLTAAIPDSARESCIIEEVVVSGKAHRGILACAEAQHADLVVMGVRGRGAADLMMFGSTTQQVVRQATCPVLTLRTR